MAATDSVTLAWINYCCREGHFHQLQKQCLEATKKYGNDPVLVFWKAFGMMMEEDLTEAIREFESVKEKRDVVLCALMALIVAYKRAKSADKATIQQLEQKLKSERTQCGETALFFGGMFLLHSGRADKAREYVDRMLKMAPSSREGLILRGWVDIRSSKEQFIKKSVKYFDEVLNNVESAKEIDALLGKVEYLKTRSNFSGGLELVNQVIVSFPDFLPGLVEKMRLQLCLMDWDQALETAHRILAVDAQNIEALKMTALALICRDGRYGDAIERIGDIIHALDQTEPRNPQLYASFAKTCARVCGRHDGLLQQTLTLVERATTIAPQRAEYVNESAYQLHLLGRARDAVRSYRQAMKIDETSILALTGIIHSQIMNEQLDDAEQQLEFLNEIQTSIGKSPEISYLRAILAIKRGKSGEHVLEILNSAVDIHFQALTGIPLGCEYFLLLNPEFLLQVVDVYLQFAPTEPESTGLSSNAALKKSMTILEPIVKTVPGLTSAIFMLAKVRYLSGDTDGAKAILQKCLDTDPTFVNAHLLMAQIHLFANNYPACESSLENGLSYNFQVKESPIYHIIRAKTQKRQGQLDEALKTLELALSLPGVRRAGSANQKPAKFVTSLGDQVMLYLELADVQRQLGMQHEAAKTMQDAINEFKGTPEEIKVTIANANLLLEKGDVERALTLLREITPEQSYYIQAREKMAQIYLKHRKDKRLYASVYRELAEKNPTPQSLMLLGDAYISIQEPEKAIEVFESALKKNPRDSILASKIGEALIKTHQYGKAITYYENAVKTGQSNFLRLDLAELHVKLANFDKAERVLKQALKEQTGTDLRMMIDEARCNLLLAQVFHKSKNIEETGAAYLRAREVQGKVLKRVGVEQPDELATQKVQAARICSMLGDFYTETKAFEKAIKSYKEATFYNEGDSTSMLSLAQLHLTNGDLDACQQQLVTVLKNNKDNDQATVMMADLMFRKNEYDAATFHFQQLLERRPDYYDALSKLVELMRRAGKLGECEDFIQKAERASPRAKVEAGFNYCKGLHQWYQNNATEALKHFNLARKDNLWGERALYNMIEICLNPDSEIVGGETFEVVDSDMSASEKQDTEQMALRTAEKLIKEVKPRENPLKLKVLENYALMGSRNNSLVSKAVANFMEISTEEKDYVPALLGMATAYMILKQTPKARNQLKRVAKMQWYSKDADDFEKSWLLLADVYIQSGKYDMSQELLKKCLQYNKSCAKAWEYMGFIMEKEQSYKDAAFNYENAWKFTNESNPAIGYRLGFNYLKARRFVDAIDVCHKVLGQHPSYPKIKKDILDKARLGIRT